MSNDQFATFTDRREAITLFNSLRGRDPAKRWPLLPILTLVAPGGSGKSLLLRYLREKECTVAGCPALPYAYLDFTLPHAPKELLPILMELRDQLQQQDDGLGNHLVFPRFDLGALLVQSTSMPEDISSISSTQVRHRLSAGLTFMTSLSDLGSSLGLAVPYVAPLLAGLCLAGQIKPIKEMLSYLENNTGWKWYRMHGTETRLGANATLKDVLLRLHFISMPGKPERDILVNELVPTAFLADLFDALLETNPPRVWSKTANLIFFLDGFEALQRTSSETATRLLELLILPQRKEGNTDPILLLVGSRDYLPGSERKDNQQALFQWPATQSDQELQPLAKTRYARWLQSLPQDAHVLRLEDLYLTFELQDFVPEDTRSYLLKFGEQRHTRLFAENDGLVQTIAQLTQGHPLFLALAAAAVLEANARGRQLTRNDFEREKVSADIVKKHSRERIRDYLLNLFLRQLTETERKELIYCAVPRFLNMALLRVLLPKLDDIDRKHRWDSYQLLTFMRPVSNERLVFHPIARLLLLRQLPADQAPESDYSRLHASLKDYFHTLANQHKETQSHKAALEQARIEEAYHALALGDPNPAIALGVDAQQHNLALWEPLLEAIVQAPAALIPEDAKQQAYASLVQAEQQHNVQDLVTAILLYTWLLTIPGEHAQVGYFQNNLGNAYRQLPGGNREANLRGAIAYFEGALEVYTREAFPVDWAATQDNLGSAYRQLPGGDREANLRQAIACYEAALEVYTREAFPVDWAATQNNLGSVYRELPGGDRETNLRQAIACYEAALEVRTREAFPVDWAGTQNNLGEAYRQLPGDDREVNLRYAIACYEQAIACYEAALEVRTREAFPVDWAGTQNNLGIAYSDLPGGDREANLRQAIACYEAALEVYTREAFPVDWAATVNNLGAAYSDLPGGDREANLRQAIACYEAALEVRTREAFPVDWAATQNNLGIAYSNLPGGDREANLRQAIASLEAALRIFQIAHIDFYASMVSRNLERAWN